MRLGLIGPAKHNIHVLRQRIEFVLDELAVDRVVYLGVDGTLDDLVCEWAPELMKGDPSDASLWEHAARTCAQASYEQIDLFLAAERRRQQLKRLECLPHVNARTIELFESVLAVLIYDKALLDEEDMLPAAILAFGRSTEPVIHRIGVRCFISPGPASHPKGGVALLSDDEADQVRASIYGTDGVCVATDVVAQPLRAARLTVQGGSGT